MANDELKHYNLDLLQSGEHSDFKLRVGQVVYNLHRSLVCPKSDVLHKALDGDFKESKINEIDLSEDDPDSVFRMITYMYSLDYVINDNSIPSPGPGITAYLTALRVGVPEHPDTSKSHTETAEMIQAKLVGHARVYALADKYNLGKLKSLAKQRFDTVIEGNPKCTNFVAVVKEVFETTPDGDLALRSAAARYFVAFSDELMNNEAFLQAMDGHIGLGASMIREISKIHAKKALDPSQKQTVKTHATNAIDSLDQLSKHNESYIKGRYQSVESAKSSMLRIIEID